VTVAVLVAAGLAGPVAEVAPAGADTVVAVPHSIDGTGATDVTAPLNAFFAGLGPGTTVVFPERAAYRVEGVLFLFDKVDLTVEGNGSMLFAMTKGDGVAPPKSGYRAYWPRRREHIHIRRGSHVTLRNLVVHGANPQGGATPEAYVIGLEGQAGVSISRSTNVVLEGMRIEDTYGDFVWITGRSSYVTIRNNTMARSGRQGIAVVNAQTIRIENNDIRGVARSVFDLEPPGRAMAQNVTMIGNRVGEYRNFLLAALGGGPNVNDVRLLDNVVDGRNGVTVAAGFWKLRRRNLQIVGNVGPGVQRAPSRTALDGSIHRGLIQLTNIDGVEIRGNRQGTAEAPAISLEGVCGLTLENNAFPGASPVVDELVPCPPPAPAG
jgi:parallel beta-helix repeat protein